MADIIDSAELDESGAKDRSAIRPRISTDHTRADRSDGWEMSSPGPGRVKAVIISIDKATAKTRTVRQSPAAEGGDSTVTRGT